MSTPPPLVRVENFHKLYDKLEAVTDLSFWVGPGEILGLVGPNGAGKTTTLRAIAGILPATQGVIEVGGHDIAKDPVAAKRILAHVPDDPKLFDSLTVWEHLQFVASAYNVTDYKPSAEALLDEFDLREKRNALAQELSRGMRQKAAICCAYLHSPKVILFDEPLSGLDPRGIRTVKDSIVKRASEDAAVIVSSHMLGLVEDLCSHLLVLQNGKRRYSGPMDHARVTYAKEELGATLEDVFFRITEEDSAHDSKRTAPE